MLQKLANQRIIQVVTTTTSTMEAAETQSCRVYQSE